MVNTEYLKIPKDRVGVTIGKNGKIKHQLEIITKTELKIDSDTGNIAISSTDETDDPLAIWKARYMIKAIGRGFNPDIALTLENDDLILNGVNIQDEITLPEISEIVSQYASIPEVRSKLVVLQRKMSEKYNVIMDGRDININSRMNWVMIFILLIPIDNNIPIS